MPRTALPEHIKTEADLQEYAINLDRQLRGIESIPQTHNRVMNASERETHNELTEQFEATMTALTELQGEVRERRMREPANNRGGLGFGGGGGLGNDSLPGGEGAGNATGFAFRDQSSGRVFRAYKPNERMAPAQSRMDGKVGEAALAILGGRGSVDSGCSVDSGFRNEAITGSDAGGNYYVQSVQFQDRMRAASQCIAAGTQTIDLSHIDRLVCSVASDPSASWRAETVIIPQSDFSFELIRMIAKTVAVRVRISEEFRQDAASSANGPQMVEDLLAKSIAAEIDRVCLLGSGAASEPRGIVSQAGVGAISSIGTPTSYSHLVSAVGDVLNANHPGPVSALSAIMHPRDAEVLENLTDTTGQPLQMPGWARDVRKFYTTKLPTTDGAGSNESTAVLGDFSNLVLGIRKEMTITSLPGPENLTHMLVCHARVDVACLRPTFFVVMSGVTAS